MDKPPEFRPPPWVAGVMMVVYPASLGLDETIADLCTRAYSSMLASCADLGCLSSEASWSLYAAVVLAISAGLASALFWMPVVYKRYETTVALPIECTPPPPPAGPSPPTVGTINQDAVSDN